MFFETVLEIEDKSYYVDRLSELTGSSRARWSSLPLEILRKRLEKEIRKQRKLNR